MRQKLFISLFIAVLTCLGACSKIPHYTNTDKVLAVFPNYAGATIPLNIAPLNFYIEDSNSEKHLVRLVAGKDSFDVKCGQKVNIPQRKWKKLLKNHAGETLNIRLFSKIGNDWMKHPDLTLQIAAEPIDPYLVYRLIEPGYEFWGEMGIYQRNLENFTETPILINTLMDGNCMNCHSFSRNNPEKMLFHLRVQHGGTLFINEGEISKINTKTPNAISAAVYPRWHPDGRFVAFSVNKTSQVFHSSHENLVEVYDSASDLIIYDTKTNTLTTPPRIQSSSRLETYPEWSPDGKTLYFCSARTLKMPDHYSSLKYDLFSVDFNPETGEIGAVVDTIFKASDIGKSVAFPRISSDGKNIMLCLSDFGTFPIWHKENDLYLLNLETREISNLLEVNSDESDSYHSWSSNGRWFVFSSRRLDGLYTRPYIAYFDSSGKAHTPFLLPQKDPLFYRDFIKSYNVPELVTGKVKQNIRTIERAAKKPPKAVRN